MHACATTGRRENGLNYSGTFSGTLCADSGVFAAFCSVFVLTAAQRDDAKGLYFQGFFWSERRDLNSRPPVPQTGALTGLRYAPSQASTIVRAQRTRNNVLLVPVPQRLLTLA